jgi:hypothetical protein
MIAALPMATPVLAQGRSADTDWVPYRNDRFGFTLEYPAALLRPNRSSQAGDGLAFVSADGSAQLLVGALANEDGYSPAEYQGFIARRSYRGFPVTYAPRGRTWFALSGEHDGKVFYEKVMFSCGGSVINSFVMTYPAAAKRRWDGVVERIENSFRPGQRCE